MKGNRAEMLRIRCSSETFKKFKRFAVDFDVYEATLNYLLDKNIVVVDEELKKWMEQKVKDGRFRNYSHAVEMALKLLREKESTRPPGAF